MKKSYYRLALLFHPDRVDENEKFIAKEKFSVVHRAYEILSDANQRERYDNGIDNEVLFTKATRSAEWEHFLKPTPDSDIHNARTSYQNSEDEKSCIEREFQAGKGSMIHLLNNVPFMRVEDEARIIRIVQQLIEDGKIPKQKIKKLKVQ